MKACTICRNQSHAAWHNVACGEINPIALIEFIEGLAPKKIHTGVRDVIVGYVMAVTGIDEPAMRAALAREAAEVKPHV